MKGVELKVARVLYENKEDDISIKQHKEETSGHNPIIIKFKGSPMMLSPPNFEKLKKAFVESKDFVRSEL